MERPAVSKRKRTTGSQMKCFGDELTIKQKKLISSSTLSTTIKSYVKKCKF
jgi:hypothetical protein